MPKEADGDARARLRAKLRGAKQQRTGGDASNSKAVRKHAPAATVEAALPSELLWQAAEAGGASTANALLELIKHPKGAEKLLRGLKTPATTTAAAPSAAAGKKQEEEEEEEAPPPPPGRNVAEMQEDEEEAPPPAAAI